MMKRWQPAIIAVLCVGLVLEAGCTSKPNAGSNQSASPSPSAGASTSGSTTGSSSGSGAQALSGDGGASMLQSGDGNVAIVKQNGIDYVEAGKLISTIGMNGAWDGANSSFSFGDNDAPVTVKAGASDAEKDGDPVKLPDSPMLMNSSLLLPVSSLHTLLGDVITYKAVGDKLQLQAVDSAGPTSLDDQTPVSSDLDFGDDPTDPFKDDPTVRTSDNQAAFNPGVEGAVLAGDDAVPALKNINIPALISKARQYLGVRYIFGAAPYPKSGGFDCSSYTQYIYGKFGISLPRLSRQQANVGQLVSRKNLRVGDLVFFYIPGRFKSNKTVGHVGIYMGNGRMINADNRPKQGVQITNIDKPFWKQTFLSARRVAY